MTKINNVAVLGTGVIGASWAALFLARGLKVKAYDPSPSAFDDLNCYIERAWPALQELGVASDAKPQSIIVEKDAKAAVAGVQFIQESVPERLPIKHALYAEIEEVLDADTIIASSASGLMPSELAKGFKDPSNLVLGHPFNPPHLVPLVEVMQVEGGSLKALESAEQFYQDLGKVTIRLHKEVPGHVANRLQAALWREAIHLFNEGVASLEDIDKAVSAGPGKRWAALGPSTLFHLAAGPGGLGEFCSRYGDSFNRWWDDLGAPRLDEKLAQKLAKGMADTNQSLDELKQERDRLMMATLRADAAARS